MSTKVGTSLAERWCVEDLPVHTNGRLTSKIRSNIAEYGLGKVFTEKSGLGRIE